MKDSIGGIGAMLHSAGLEPSMQIAVFKMLTDAEGETAKIEKEKKCLMEIYMLFSNPVEIHTVKLYISNCNIR